MQPLAELPFIAGDVALDFVNTAELRGDPLAGDVLQTPADLVQWGRRYGLLSSDANAADEAELRAALETRELLYRLFDAHASQAIDPPTPTWPHSPRPSPGRTRRGGSSPATTAGCGGSGIRSRPATIRDTAAVAATELLRGDRSDRLKQCPGEHCGWLFLDATKRGNRRWCSMSECGQDAKTARRRERRPTARRG